MNRRTIGVFIAATIAVMIIASTNIGPMIQQRQAYAASPTTATLKDNLRASLENRNQHLNQQGNCVRTDGCSTSNVGQGTLGNDNSVTGFADQSTINTTTANAATAGPAGAKGDPGAKGDKGDPGPAGPDKILSTREVIATVDIAPGTINDKTVDCASNEFVTGGGFSVTPAGLGVEYFVNLNHRFGTNGWIAGLFNNSTTSISLTTAAECAKLVPPP